MSGPPKQRRIAYSEQVGKLLSVDLYTSPFPDSAALDLGRSAHEVGSPSGNHDTVKYFHVDHLGSTRLVTSSSAAVQFIDSYQPFGQDNGTPTGSATYKFTGKPYGSPTGLYYNFQRRLFESTLVV